MTTVKKTIYQRMNDIMNDIGAIAKDQKNQAQGFNFRGIDGVYNAMHNIMAKHGVFSVPCVLDKTREERVTKSGSVLAFTCLRMKYTFYGADGDSVECVVEGEGMDSGDKSSNKAMAVAHKYALLQVFCIPTEEQKDPDADTHEVVVKTITESQAVDLGALIQEVDADAVKFFKHFGIDNIYNLPADKLDTAISMLEKKRRRVA